MSDAHSRASQDVIEYARRTYAEHLVYATAGNLSTRVAGEPHVIAMTPTSMAYDTLEPSDICMVTTNGLQLHGRREPTTELPLHTLLYAARPEVGAIIHTHSRAAMTMAVLGWELPPILTGLVRAVGGEVRVAPYSPPGTRELADSIADGLADRGACFMRQHGLVAVGANLAHAFLAASATEAAARVYLDARAQQIEVPQLLRDEVTWNARLWLRQWSATPSRSE